MKRLTILFLTVLVMMAVSSSLCAAGHVTTSLYVDPSGWVINQMDKMYDLPKFSEWFDTRNDSDNPMNIVYNVIEGKGNWELYRYVRANDVNEWWRFEIDFASNEVLSIPSKEAFVITATLDKMNMDFRSSEIIFTNRELSGLQKAPVDISGADQNLDVGDNGLKMYVRFPGTGGVHADEVTLILPEGVSLLKLTSNR